MQRLVLLNLLLAAQTAAGEACWLLCSVAWPLVNWQLSLSSQTGIISLYDCVFKRKLDYNQKLHRDDREHANGLGLHVNKEVILRWSGSKL